MAHQDFLILGQRDPLAANIEILYTVPGAPVTGAVVSTIMICNRSATPTTFRVALSPAGAPIADLQYIVFDDVIGANKPYEVTVGLTLAPTDLIRVRATLATLSFTACGSEIKK